MGDSLMNDIQNDFSEFSVGLEINGEHIQKSILDNSEDSLSHASIKSQQSSVTMISNLLISDASCNDEFSKFIEMPMDNDFHAFSTQLNLQQNCVVELPPRPDSGGDSGPDTEPDAELSLSYVSSNRQRASERCAEDILFGRHNSEGMCDDSIVSVVGSGATSFLSTPVSSSNASMAVDQFNSASSASGIGFVSDSHTKYPGELLRLVDHLVKENQSLKAQINYSSSSSVMTSTTFAAHSIVTSALESDTTHHDQEDCETELIPKGGFLQSLHESDEMLLPSSQPPTETLNTSTKLLPIDSVSSKSCSGLTQSSSTSVSVQAAAAAGVTPEYLAQLSSKTAALYGPGRVMLMNNQFVFVPDTQPALAAMPSVVVPSVQKAVAAGTPALSVPAPIAVSNPSSTIPVSIAAAASVAPLSGGNSASAAGQQMMVTGHVSGGCVYISLPPGVNASSILSVGGQVVNSSGSQAEKVVIGPSAIKASSVQPPTVKPSPSKKSAASTYRLQPVVSSPTHASAVVMQNNANRRLRKLLPRDAARDAAQPIMSNVAISASSTAATASGGGFYSSSDAAVSVLSSGATLNVDNVNLNVNLTKSNSISGNNKKKKKKTLTLQDIGSTAVGAAGNTQALISQTLVPAAAAHISVGPVPAASQVAAAVAVQQPTHANVVYQATPQGYQPVLATPQGYGTVQWSAMPYQLSMTSTTNESSTDKLTVESSNSNKLDILHQAMMEMGGDFFTIDNDGVIESSLHQQLDSGCIGDDMKVDESVDLSVTVDPIDLDQLINTFSANENDADNKVFEESLSVTEMVSLESMSSQINNCSGGDSSTSVAFPKKSRSRPSKPKKKDVLATSCIGTIIPSGTVTSAGSQSFISLEHTTPVKPLSLLQSLDSDQCGATMQQFHEALLDFESPPFSQSDSLQNECVESTEKDGLSMQLHLQAPSPLAICSTYGQSLQAENDVVVDNVMKDLEFHSSSENMKPNCEVESQLNQQLRQPLTIDTSEMPHSDAELLSLPSGLLSELGVEPVSPNKLSLTTPNKINHPMTTMTAAMTTTCSVVENSLSIEMNSPELVFQSYPPKSAAIEHEDQQHLSSLKLCDELLGEDDLLKNMASIEQEHSSNVISLTTKRSSSIKIKRPSFARCNEFDSKVEEVIVPRTTADSDNIQAVISNDSKISDLECSEVGDVFQHVSFSTDPQHALKSNPMTASFINESQGQCDLAFLDSDFVADNKKEKCFNNSIVKQEEKRLNNSIAELDVEKLKVKHLNNSHFDIDVEKPKVKPLNKSHFDVDVEKPKVKPLNNSHFDVDVEKPKVKHLNNSIQAFECDANEEKLEHNVAPIEVTKCAVGRRKKKSKNIKDVLTAETNNVKETVSLHKTIDKTKILNVSKGDKVGLSADIFTVERKSESEPNCEEKDSRKMESSVSMLCEAAVLLNYQEDIDNAAAAAVLAKVKTANRRNATAKRKNKEKQEASSDLHDESDKELIEEAKLSSDKRRRCAYSAATTITKRMTPSRQAKLESTELISARNVESSQLDEVLPSLRSPLSSKVDKKDSKKNRSPGGKRCGSNSSSVFHEDQLSSNNKKLFKSSNSAAVVSGGAPISPLFPSMDLCGGGSVTTCCSNACQLKSSSHAGELFQKCVTIPSTPPPQLTNCAKFHKNRINVIEDEDSSDDVSLTPVNVATNYQSPQEKERTFMTPEESAELEDFVDLPQIAGVRAPLSVITEPSATVNAFQHQKSTDLTIFGSCKSTAPFSVTNTTFGQYALDEMPTFGALVSNKSKASLFESENSFTIPTSEVSTSDSQDGLVTATLSAVVILQTESGGGSGGGGGWYDHKGKQITSPNKVLFAEVKLPAPVEPGAIIGKRRGRKPNLKQRRRDAAKVSPIKLKRPLGGTELQVVEKTKPCSMTNVVSEAETTDTVDLLTDSSGVGTHTAKEFAKVTPRSSQFVEKEEMSSPDDFAAAEHKKLVDALEENDFGVKLTTAESEENSSDVCQPPQLTKQSTLSLFSCIDSSELALCGGVALSHPHIESVHVPPVSSPQNLPQLSPLLLTTRSVVTTSTAPPSLPLISSQHASSFAVTVTSATTDAIEDAYDEQQLAADSEQLFGKDNLMRDFSTYQKSTMCKKKRSNSSITTAAVAVTLDVKEASSGGSGLFLEAAAHRPRKFFSTRRDDRRSASLRSVGAGCNSQESLSATEKVSCAVDVKQSFLLAASVSADAQLKSGKTVAAVADCNLKAALAVTEVAGTTASSGGRGGGKKSPRAAFVTTDCAEPLSSSQTTHAFAEVGGGVEIAAVFDFEEEANRAKGSSKGKKKEAHVVNADAAGTVALTIKRKRGRPPKQHAMTPRIVEDQLQRPAVNVNVAEDVCNFTTTNVMPKPLLKLKIKRDQTTSNFSVSEAATQDLDDSFNDDNMALVVDEDADFEDETRDEMQNDEDSAINVDLLTVEDDPQPFKERLPDNVTELSVCKELNQHYQSVEEAAAASTVAGDSSSTTSKLVDCHSSSSDKKHKEPKKKKKKDKKNKEKDKNKHHHHKKKNKHLLRLVSPSASTLDEHPAVLIVPPVADRSNSGSAAATCGAFLFTPAGSAIFDAKSPELLTKITKKGNSDDADSVVDSTTTLVDQQQVEVATKLATPPSSLSTSARTNTPCALPKKRKLNLPSSSSSSSGLSPQATTTRHYESIGSEADPAQKRSRSDYYQHSPLSHLEMSLGSVPVSTPTVWDYGASSALAAAAMMPHAAKLQQEENRLFQGSPPPPSAIRDVMSHNHNLQLSQSQTISQQPYGLAAAQHLLASQTCGDLGGRSSRSPAPPNLTHFGAAAAAAVALSSATGSVGSSNLDRSTPQQYQHMPSMSRNWLSGGLPVSSSLLNFELDSNIPDIRETLAAAAVVAAANKCNNGNTGTTGAAASGASSTSLFGNQLPPPPSLSRPPPPPVPTHVPTRGQPPPAHSSTVASSRSAANSSPYVYEAPAPPPPSDTWARAMAASRPPYSHDYSNYYSVMYSAAVQQQLQLQYHQQQWYAAAANDEAYQQQVSHAAAAASANAGGGNGPSAAVAYQQQHHPASLYGLYGAATAAAANMHHHQHPSHHPFN